jgi:protease I
MTNALNLQGKKIAIVATNGFEPSELADPKKMLADAGAHIEVISINGNTSIKGFDGSDWREEVKVDKQIEDAKLSDYDAVVIPGGQVNPDILRTNEKVVAFIKAAGTAGNIKALAAICHGPWLLVEADLVRDKKLTSYPSIKTDLINAGAHWNDQAVVTDGKFITSRNPDDIPKFVEQIIKAVAG